MLNYLIAMADVGGDLRAAGAQPQRDLGLAGLVNLGLVGFFAVGAYASALPPGAARRS